MAGVKINKFGSRLVCRDIDKKSHQRTSLTACGQVTCFNPPFIVKIAFQFLALLLQKPYSLWKFKKLKLASPSPSPTNNTIGRRHLLMKCDAIRNVCFGKARRENQKMSWWSNKSLTASFPVFTIMILSARANTFCVWTAWRLPDHTRSKTFWFSDSITLVGFFESLFFPRLATIAFTLNASCPRSRAMA